MPSILTLLTDFGLADYYVGAVKGTVLRLAPETQLVDLSHEVPAGDVEAGADLLAAAAPSFPAGTVHLAVIDPGVGSARRLLVVRFGGHHFVAPDNGLLTAALAAGGETWSVTRDDLFLDLVDDGGARGATFHGRDRFAPIAAALLRGEAPHTLGEPIDDAVRLALPAPRRERDAAGWTLHGRVARVDRFGNLVTDLPADWLAAADGDATLLAQVGDIASTLPARVARVRCYDELPPGEPGILVGSLGTLELSLRGESLAARWATRRGAAVRLQVSTPSGDGAAPRPA
ncbi:MAG TPA: SAM-dependent chlorinase/fluorinase [Thermoanaerobaculia bacterium]|nr:SAM-dependent chlorinase/fluorinase [Thermoanaerobaculia bacterium]